MLALLNISAVLPVGTGISPTALTKVPSRCVQCFIGATAQACHAMAADTSKTRWLALKLSAVKHRQVMHCCDAREQMAQARTQQQHLHMYAWQTTGTLLATRLGTAAISFMLLHTRDANSAEPRCAHGMCTKCFAP